MSMRIPRIPQRFLACLLGALWAVGQAALLAADPGFRSLALPEPSGTRVGFTRIDPSAAGLTFTNVLAGDAYFTNAVAHNGSGVAIGDVDGDGRPDLYLCGLN